MRDIAWIGGMVGAILLAVIPLVLLFMGGMMFLFYRADLPAQLARIEQLRHDVAVVQAPLGEDVVGQVTETNQTIAARQAANDTWWYGWIIPDEWDAVEFIAIP